ILNYLFLDSIDLGSSLLYFSIKYIPNWLQSIQFFCWFRLQIRLLSEKNRFLLTYQKQAEQTFRECSSRLTSRKKQINTPVSLRYLERPKRQTFSRLLTHSVMNLTRNYALYQSDFLNNVVIQKQLSW